MANIIRSPEARQDAADIWLHIALDNITAADKLAAEFDQRLNVLAENPNLGRSRDDLAPTLRSHPVGHYIIVYRSITDGIEVVRVVHGARNAYGGYSDNAVPPRRSDLVRRGEYYGTQLGLGGMLGPEKQS